MIRYTKKEKATTSPHQGDLMAFNIMSTFDKGEVNAESDPNLKAPYDAWKIIVTFDDGSMEELSMSKVPNISNKHKYMITAKKDKFQTTFTDNDDMDKSLEIPKDLKDHLKRHVNKAKDNKKAKSDNNDIAKLLAWQIQMDIPSKDIEILDSDDTKGGGEIHLVYPDGSKDFIRIVRKEEDSFEVSTEDGVKKIYTLDQLKNLPSLLKKHIEKHIKV